MLIVPRPDTPFGLSRIGLHAGSHAVQYMLDHMLCRIVYSAVTRIANRVVLD